MTRSEDLKRLVNETVEAHGGVDIVVPNAGIARVVSFENSTREAFETQFSVNLFGAAETARLFIPHIRKGGSIQRPYKDAQDFDTAMSIMERDASPGLRRRRETGAARFIERIFPGSHRSGNADLPPAL